MLESERYNRSLRTNSDISDPEFQDLQVFLDQEYITQFCLNKMGLTVNDSPNKLPRVNEIFTIDGLVGQRRSPYALEVLGMPRAGKSTSINKFLESLWTKGVRRRIHLIREGARTVSEEYEYLKNDDTFGFHMVAGQETFLSTMENILSFEDHEVILYDRGTLDRRAFRRAMFFQGKVSTKITRTEKLWEYGFETPPFQIGGLIMCLIKPEVSLEREGVREKPGTVMNKEFLTLLYEQYMRLHYEIMSGSIITPAYTCIDMGCSEEEAYTKICDAMVRIIDAKYHTQKDIAIAHK